MATALYRARILDHFQHPRHKGSLEGMDAIGRGAIPLCGDEVEVGIREMDDAGLAVRFRGRGCALCMASASIMAEALTGRSRNTADPIARDFLGWMLDGKEATLLTQVAPDLIDTFAPVREAGARARCAALPWGALREALEQG